MDVDLIIPTYQNAKVLPLTLAALNTQEVPRDWQVRLIISDDGSTDNTNLVLKHHNSKSRWPCEIIYGQHAGVAAARNRAIKNSSAEIIFLLGADIILRPGALLKHLLFHETHPDVKAAALGMITWDPRLQPTPLLDWMIHGGPQNNYDSLLGALTADPRHFFYGSHLSLKRTMFRKELFSEVFTRYGWEDLDLGRRLARLGLILHVLHSARAVHQHRYSVQMIGARQRASGYGLHLFQSLHPNEFLIPKVSGKHRFLYVLVVYTGLLPLIGIALQVFNQISLPRTFRLFTHLHTWLGIIEGSGKTQKSGNTHTYP